MYHPAKFHVNWLVNSGVIARQIMGLNLGSVGGAASVAVEAAVLQ